MIEPPVISPVFRHPDRLDGGAIWSLIKKTGTLDLNSSYAYFIISDYFKSTSLIAEINKCVAGFVTAYRSPTQNDLLFVWQIGVDPDFQGSGIAKSLLVKLLEKNSDCKTIHTTISPSNKASRALFTSFSRDAGFSMKEEKYLRTNDFPEMGHEDENLFILEKK